MTRFYCARRTTVRPLLALALLAAFAGCDASTEEVSSPSLPNGTLLFVARDTTVADPRKGFTLYSVDLRSGAKTVLTSDAETGPDRDLLFDAVWSPDGRRLVYHEGIGIDAGHLTLLNADGTGRRVLTDPQEHRARPTWGADDQTVFFDQRVYLGASVGLYALNVETAPQSGQVCIICDPNFRNAAPPFMLDGTAIRTSAIAPGPSSGLVVLGTRLDEVAIDRDDDVLFYLADYRTRQVGRRLTETPLRGIRFVLARGGRSVLFLQRDRPSTEADLYPPLTLYVVSELGRPPVAVKLPPGFNLRSSLRDYRWASDGRHALVTLEVSDARQYSLGTETYLLDAQSATPTLERLAVVPRTVQSVPDLHIIP